MGDLIRDVRYIVTEGQYKQLYHDTPLIDDIEDYLMDYDFVLSRAADHNDWFGDFYFVRVDKV